MEYTVKLNKISELKNHYTLCEGSSGSIYKRHKHFEYREDSKKSVQTLFCFKISPNI